jgi:hypothetical protein
MSLVIIPLFGGMAVAGTALALVRVRGGALVFGDESSGAAGSTSLRP